MADRPALSVTSSVLCVSVLERSIDFYQQVLSCEVSLRNREAALLLAPDGFQIYLVCRGPQPHLTSRGVGHQYLVWSVAGVDELEDVAAALQACGGRLDRSSVDGITYVSAHDPDGIRIVVAHPHPQDHPRRQVPPRFFA